MHRTTPHQRMIQPKISTAKGRKRPAMSSPSVSHIPDPSSHSKPPTIPPLQAFHPTSPSTPHSSITDPFSPVISSSGPSATKSGNVARAEGIYGEKVPSNAWEMWFPVRLSKAMLQVLATQAVPAVVRGIFSNTYKHTSSAMCLGMYLKKKKLSKNPNLKVSLHGERGEREGESRPKWFTKYINWLIHWSEVKWSEVAQLCPTLCDPMDSSLHQAPPSMGFF